jgi:hypothetical protein
MPFLPILALGIVALVVLSLLGYQQWRAARWNNCSWQELVVRLDQVNRTGIDSLAVDYLNPQGNQLRLEPPEMWGLIGGVKGVKAMRHNAEVLIALASYAERWNYDESVIVAERMRHDALLLRKTSNQILWRMRLRVGMVRVPFYLHQSATAYHLMTTRLLTLYEGSQRVFYPRLAEAIG